MMVRSRPRNQAEKIFNWSDVMAGRRWAEDEVAFLQEHVGSDEVQFVIKAFLKQWPDREPDAILTKIKRLGLSRVPVDGDWNCTGLAEILGCNRDRVHDWIVRGLLKTRRKNGKRHHRILERDFVTFATQYPEWLKDIPLDRLDYLLSEPVVNMIASIPDRTRGVRFKVRSDRTGRVYESLRSAEKYEFLSRGCISQIVKTGRTTREGFGFQLIQRGD
jgi:hypothetical protein